MDKNAREKEWRFRLSNDSGLFLNLVKKASQQPWLRELFPVRSMNSLRFSRNEEYPYRWELPYLSVTPDEEIEARGWEMQILGRGSIANMIELLGIEYSIDPTRYCHPFYLQSGRLVYEIGDHPGSILGPISQLQVRIFHGTWIILTQNRKPPWGNEFLCGDLHEVSICLQQIIGDDCDTIVASIKRSLATNQLPNTVFTRGSRTAVRLELIIE
jgi:hypothetical protein